MNLKVFINDYNYISPLGLERKDFIKADSINYVLLSNKANNPIAEIVFAVNLSESYSLTESMETSANIAKAKVFPHGLYSLPVSSTKSQSSHALYASCGIEISSILTTFEEKFISANINCDVQDEDIKIQIIKKPILNKKIKYALKNSSGMGGYNSCTLLKNET